MTNPFLPTTVPLRVPKVLLVGDSTMAGLRWFTNAKKALTGASFIVDVESCRAIASESCYGREKRIPTNTYTAIRSVKDQLDLVVVMAGSHNEPATIESELQSIRRLVQKRGAKLVVLTLRDPYRPNNAVTKESVTSIRRINQLINRIFQTSDSTSSSVADWRTFSTGHSNWFRQDRIHLNLRGSLALGWYLSQITAHVLGTPCDSSDAMRCAMPSNKDSFVDWLQRFHVKYTNQHCYEDGSKRTAMCERDRRMP